MEIKIVSRALPSQERIIQTPREEVMPHEDGCIDESQRGVLYRHRLLYLAGSACFFTLLVLLAAAITIKIAHPSFGARGPFWLGSALAVVWLMLLRRTSSQYRRIRRDLREGRTASVTGPVFHHLSSTPGVIPLLRYRIRCGGQRFSVPQDVFFRLQAGQVYRVYHARHSGIFLDAVPHAAGTNTSDPALPAPAQVDFDPLLQREQEVLERIALGLSNQEIADQLYLSIHTIKMYTSQLYRKLGVRRRTEAVRRARKLGLLPPS